MASIYISSTYKDLRQCREKVYLTLRQLGHDARAMEDYVATDERPRERCEADVRASELYVGILAWRYGYVPEENNPDEVSITELEYRAAEAAGVPRLMFLLADDANWSVQHVDAGPERERIDGFRSRVQRETTVSSFENCDQLAKLVAVAVQRAQEARAADERAQLIDDRSASAALMRAMRTPEPDRNAALLQWSQKYGTDVARVLGRQAADRFRSHMSKRRARERDQRLERTVQQAVSDALKQQEGHTEGR